MVTLEPIAAEISELDDRALVLQNNGMSRRDALRQIIDAVERQCHTVEGHTGPHPFPLEHDFADGLYLRTIHSPAGTLVVGMIHKYAHFCFVESGDVSVLTEDGPVRFQGPRVLRSPAGSKRIVYHHTDVVWRTVHATHETDVEKIEQEIIAPNYAALENVS